MGVTHKPKGGSLLTGTEYEAADAHVVAIAHSDLSSVTANQHHNQSHTQGDHTGTGATSTQAFGDSPADGTGTKPANIDHKHGMPSERAAASTTPAAIGTAAVGVGTTDARADHVHATGAGTPSTQAIGDAAATGSGPAAAMTDHKHAMPAFGTGPAAVGTQANGSSANIARIDHVHATGAGTPSTQAFGDAATTGSGPAAAMTDHKHAMPTLGFGLTNNATPAVSLTTASAFITATTSLSAATYADITGASITLAAGTWLIMADVYATDTTTTAGLLVAAITDSSNVVVVEGAQSIPAGTATVSTWGHVGLSAIVTPGSTTTYKLRGARGTTTATATLVVQDGSPQNVANNASTNSDKGTGLRAIRVA